MILGTLAFALAVQSRNTGDMTALDEALAIRREVVAMRPPGDAARAGRLRDLATTLRQVHETTGDLGARDEAVRLDAEAELITAR